MASGHRKVSRKKYLNGETETCEECKRQFYLSEHKICQVSTSCGRCVECCDYSQEDAPEEWEVLHFGEPEVEKECIHKGCQWNSWMCHECHVSCAMCCRWDFPCAAKPAKMLKLMPCDKELIAARDEGSIAAPYEDGVAQEMKPFSEMEQGEMPEDQLDLPSAVQLFADEMSEIEQGEMPEDQLDLSSAVQLFAGHEDHELEEDVHRDDERVTIMIGGNTACEDHQLEEDVHTEDEWVIMMTGGQPGVTTVGLQQQSDLQGHGGRGPVVAQLQVVLRHAGEVRGSMATVGLQQQSDL